MALVVVERPNCPRHDRFIRTHERKAPAVHQLAVVQISSELQFRFRGGHSLGVDLSPQTFQLLSVGKTVDGALKTPINSSPTKYWNQSNLEGGKVDSSSREVGNLDLQVGLH